VPAAGGGLPVSPFRLPGGFIIPPWPRFPRLLSFQTAQLARSGWKSWSFDGELSCPQRGLSAGSHTPITHGLITLPAISDCAFAGSMSGHPLTTAPPESLCLTSALAYPKDVNCVLRSWLLGTQAPIPLSPPSACAWCGESFQVATSPCCRLDLPEVIPANPALVPINPIPAVRGVP